MRTFPILTDPRRSERGGITIVIALVLIVLMSLAAFSLSRNAIRDLATSGSVIQGDKASSAADAGLDWFVVWSHPDNVSLAIGNSGATGNYNLARAITDLKSPDWYTRLTNDGLIASTDSSRSWDMAALVKSDESQMAANDMVFDNTTASAVLQAKNSSGDPVVQRFDLQIRFLGFQPTVLTGGGGNAAGGTNPNANASQDTAWQVISTGNAAIPMGGGNYLRYQQRREIIGTQALSQSAK
ncbi:MAG TPA: pilus assembly PilX N-terminal domain-containing protein [Holophagaceae bacterium]|nr:pilus assembly PilX N-terminal domain-containing protein [Holophagaceae bacterium]